MALYLHAPLTSVRGNPEDEYRQDSEVQAA